MIKLINLLFILSVITLVGCKQDPYPTEGVFRKEPVVQGQQPLPALAISVGDKIEYREGRNLALKIRVEVEEPGEPIVKIDGLPEGASFDPKTFMLSWTPNYFQGNDINDASIKARFYPITIWLRSSALPKEYLRKTVNLVVFDIPRAIGIGSSRNSSVNENSEFNETITISNPDYPQGPFKLLTKDLPANMKIEEISPTQFKLSYKPDYFHVNRARGESSKVYNGKIIVSNPANHIEEVDYKFTVKDVRREVKVVAPESLTQGLDVSFQVASYDLNREISPDMTLLTSRPGFGNFRTEVIKNEDSFSSVMNIYWTDIPPVYNGTTQTLKFKACVLGSWGNRRDECKEEETEVKIVLRDRTAPGISRDDWERGELIYLGFNESMTRNIKVVDNEDRSLTPRVEVFPTEMREFVSWSRGKLRLRFNKAGVFQFNLVATSDYNMSSAESFIVEVFPNNRNKTLLFADSTRDPEALFYKSAFKGTMDIMNPAIQEVNLRNISDRETLVITTSTLLDESVQAEVLSAIKGIKNIVVASPLIRKLPPEFLTTLEEEYDFLPIGRYSELPNMPDLSKMKFVAVSKFATPVNAVGVKQKASKESHDPMIFNGGLHDPDKICKGVLGLSETGTNPYVTGVSCARKNGGRISILGTEWADLLTQEADKEIPAKWFDTLLNGKF
ncbi:MAG: hypothetical protein ACJAT2_000543 [Bacteriovoracaceae bacterium]|jgi:hypothetical protein